MIDLQKICKNSMEYCHTSHTEFLPMLVSYISGVLVKTKR